ncbi:UNVERIFIED_CONTAM: hypothetical protein RMT77_013891 [Armadillidium vulgare]
MQNSFFSVPSDHILLCRRSQVNLLLGNDQDALRDACEATLHRPEWAMGYFCKSNALLALGREEDALVAMLVYALLANPEDGERVHYEVAKLILLILRRSAVRADGAQAFLSASRRDRRCPKEIEKAAAESLRAKRKKRRSSSIKTSFRHFITEEVPVVARVMSRLSSEVSKIKNCVNSYKVTVNNVSHSSDFECPLCFLCFWEPVTTVCGHTFCRACLARSLDHASQCPLCKTSLRGYNMVGNGPTVNQFLEHAMKTLVPKDYSERSLQHTYELSELSKAGQDLQHEMPIFVATMAIPSISCPLHVFEPRYRLMIRRVMEAGTKEFGMCMLSQIGEKGFSNYGTLLKIVEVKPFNDGRSIVHAVGTRRFRCVSKSMRDGYNTSTIEYIEDKVVSDEDLPKLKLLHDVVNKRARLWLKIIESDMRQRILSHYGEMPSTENEYWLLSDGPMWVWWLLAILPLEPTVLIRIIKEQSLTARLSQVSQALKYIVTHQSKTKR